MNSGNFRFKCLSWTDLRPSFHALSDEEQGISSVFGSNAVTPWSETVREFPGCRSLSFARRTRVVGCSMSVAEEAEKC